MPKVTLFFSVVLSTLLAQAAYFQADLKSPTADPNVGVHLIISGFGGPANETVGDQWMTIAHTQALVFNDKTKHGPIRLISYIDNASTYQKKLSAWNYQNVKVMNQVMTGSRIVNLIGQNEKIASIDFIGHNGAFMGLALEDYSNRFYLNDVKSLAAYKSKFTADSFIRIMGCNTGWYLAPQMSQMLGVPTSGTFTYADIQDIFTPMTWYYHDEGRFPKGAKVMAQNSLSYSAPMTCTYAGGCKRLKVVSISYAGQRGTYIGTLPFAKYFCGSMNMNDCARRAALSVSTNISASFVSDKPTAAQFAEGVSEAMCNSWQDLSRRAACVKAVTNHLNGVQTLSPTFKTIDEKVLTCSFKSCDSKVIVDQKGQNVLTGIFTKPSTAFVDELNFYKLGFSLIK